MPRTRTSPQPNDVFFTTSSLMYLKVLKASSRLGQVVVSSPMQCWCYVPHCVNGHLHNPLDLHVLHSHVLSHLCTYRHCRYTGSAVSYTVVMNLVIPCACCADQLNLQLVCDSLQHMGVGGTSSLAGPWEESVRRKLTSPCDGKCHWRTSGPQRRHSQ